MKARIDEWLEAKEAAERADIRVGNLLEAAEAQEPPANLIPARPEHVVKGAIIWYPGWKNSAHWQQVEEVHKPDDEFKAYTGHDGCRYGLDGAFVEPRVESIKFSGSDKRSVGYDNKLQLTIQDDLTGLEDFGLIITTGDEKMNPILLNVLTLGGRLIYRAIRNRRMRRKLCPTCACDWCSVCEFGSNYRPN